MIPSFYKNKGLQLEQSTELLEGRVLVLDEGNGAAVSGAVFQIEAVVLEQLLEGTPAVIQPLFDDVGSGTNGGKMAADVLFAHHQKERADAAKGLRGKILFPMKWDIAAFYNQVLMIFDDRLDHLPHDGPQVVGQLLVVGGGKGGLTAANQTHLQVVDGKVWDVQMFHQLLCQPGFAGVRGAAEQDNHSRILLDLI